MKDKLHHHPFNIVVIVAALGYFVDIYDLILFGIVRDASLRELGVAHADLFRVGSHLLNMQMIGMLLGGIVWGVLGDKRGRLSTLFLTILLYSVANVANGFVSSIPQYSWLRFISGFGLAGELGIGVTLVSEVMSEKSRGLGASIVSGIGILGAVLAFFIAEQFDWRIAYYFGGGLGLLLLIMRVSVYESGMYEKAKTHEAIKGDFSMFFRDLKRFRKYFLVILAGIPTWYVVSILVINASNFAADALGIAGPVKGSTSVMLHYTGAAIGSLLFGILSGRLRSRLKAMFLANLGVTVLTAAYFMLTGIPSWGFYLIIFLLGVPMGGLWTVFITVSSELFGTNLRATATTSAPNFVRGATVLISMVMTAFIPLTGLRTAGLITGGIFLLTAFIAIIFLEETYGKDLDYME